MTIGQKMGLTDVIMLEKIATLKWNWLGELSQTTDERGSINIMKYISSQKAYRNKGRPLSR